MATNEPGCNGDISCNAGYQAGIHAYNDAFNAGAGSTATPWWLDVETTTEQEKFAHATACLMKRPNVEPDVATFIAWCADDVATFDEKKAMGMLKQLGLDRTRALNHFLGMQQSPAPGVVPRAHDLAATLPRPPLRINE